MSGGGASLGKIDLSYYVVPKGKKSGYWRPNAAMRALGFADVRCGKDGPAAWAIADAWNRRWHAVRTGQAPAPSALEAAKGSREEIELARRYPPGSVGTAFQRYLRTDEWKSKALGTRTKVWWPAWFRIRDMWGDIAPDTITFDQMSTWRADLERAHSRGVAHKTLKVWRALWNVMLGMKIASQADPSTGIRNRKPKGRHERWEMHEASRLAKTAWREGYHGLACIIAATWDSMFQPGDTRTICARHRAWRREAVRKSDGSQGTRQRLWFDKSEDGRIKTGRATLGTLTLPTQRLIEAYLGELAEAGIELLPDAPLFRTRSGAPYRDDKLSEDFAAVRAIAYPGETRKLMDMRRSGAVEAVAGSEGEDFSMKLAAKMANSIDTSNELHRTYAPNTLAPVLEVDEARRRGRRKMRETERSASDRNKF